MFSEACDFADSVPVCNTLKEALNSVDQIDGFAVPLECVGGGKLRVQMRIEIKRLQQRLGVTAVYVTHDQVEAMTLGHRLVVLNEGRAEQIGAPMNLYNRPSATFVVGFIGSPAINLAAAASNGASVDVGGASQPLPPGMRASGLPSHLRIGVRPEHFELTSAQNVTLTVAVELVEALGADTLVHAHAGEAARTLRLPGGAPVNTGGRLPMRTAPDHVHLFDRSTGARVV